MVFIAGGPADMPARLYAIYNTLFLLFLLFDSGESSGHPHLRAGMSTTTMSSMVTPSIAANMTRLSMVGKDVPWIHL